MNGFKCENHFMQMFFKTNLNINIHRYDTRKQEHGRYKL